MLNMSQAKIPQSRDTSLEAFIEAIQLFPSQKTEYHYDLFIRFLSSYDTLNHLIGLSDSQESASSFYLDFAELLAYKSFKPNSFIQRLDDERRHCHFLFSGTVIDLVVKFKKQLITCDEYLTHLIKLKFLNETGLYKQCIQSNKHIKETDSDAIEKIPKKRYKVIEAKANDCLFQSKEYISLKGHADDSNLFVNDYISLTSLAKIKDSVDEGFKKAYVIPYFEVYSYLPKGSFIGDFFSPVLRSQAETLNQHVFISATHADTGVIDIKSAQQSRFVQGIKSKMTRAALRNSYFLFQNIDRSKFINVYSNQFSYVIVRRGDRFILQDTYANGIYMSNVGSFEISLISQFKDLDSFIQKLKSSQLGNKELSVSSFDKPERNSSHEKDNNALYQNNHTLQLLSAERKIKLNTVTSKEIFGLNEFYDHKSHVYHFTVECTSEVGGLFYLPREAFWDLFNKESSIMSYLSTFIDSKVMYYIATINRFKDLMSQVMGAKPKRPSHSNQGSPSFQSYSTEPNITPIRPQKRSLMIEYCKSNNERRVRRSANLLSILQMKPPYSTKMITHHSVLSKPLYVHSSNKALPPSTRNTNQSQEALNASLLPSIMKSKNSSSLLTTPSLSKSVNHIKLKSKKP